MKQTILVLMVFLSALVGVNASPVLYRKALPNLHVNTLMQDEQGFMWIATAKGLHKYDGSGYYSYYADAGDTSSLPSDNLTSLYRDARNRLWVATIEGICRYDAAKNCFVRYADPSSNGLLIYGFFRLNGRLLAYGKGGIYRIDDRTKSMEQVLKLDREVITHLRTDSLQRMWCVCEGGTVMCVDRRMNLLHKVSFGWKNEVCCVYTDSGDGNILFGTKKGLVTMDGATFALLPNNCPEEVTNASITCIQAYGKGRVLLGTQSKGVMLYDLANRCLLPYDLYSYIESKEITSFFIDREKRLWVGTFDKGFYLLNTYAGAFNCDKLLARRLAGKFVTRFLEDKEGYLWIGTRYHGLYCYRADKQEMRVFNSENTPFLRRYTNNFVQDLFVDSRGRLWMCYENSLMVCSIEGGNLRLLKEFENTGNIVTLAEDARHRIWAGKSSEGIEVYSNDLKRLTELTPALGMNNITKLMAWDDRHILLASYGDNLYLMDIRTYKLSLLDSRYRESWKNAITLMRGNDGNLWIGTYGNGMFRYNTSTRKLTAYRQLKGFESNDIIGLLQDNKGRIWMSSSYGIYSLDPTTGTMRAYLQKDGTGGDQMHEKCGYRRKDGTLLFGGNHGVTEVAPANIPPAPTHIPVYLTDLKLFNRSVQIDDRSHLLKQAIAYTRNITLKHNQNVFTLDFIGLAYDCPTQLNYAYRLVDFDQGWNEVGSYTRAGYSNLPAGTYTFEVKVQNRDGIWTAPSRLLTICVLPSPWLHPLALTAYGILLLLLLIVVIRIYIRLKLSKERYVMAQKEVARERGLAQMKVNFFTNISHEIRTPLTMICSPVKMLAASPKWKEEKELAPYLDLINSNAERLMRLIDQLLDFGKVKNDTLELRVSRNNCLLQLQTIVKLYRLYVAERNIDIALECPYDSLDCVYDADKLEKIMNNLLFNAAKYTPDNGHILVRVALLKHPTGFALPTAPDITYLQIQIADDGIGLGKETIGLFSRFRRLRHWIKGRNVKGSGIGLDYVKHLVENHKGQIRAENGKECGSIFTFILPVDDKEYEADEHAVEAAESVKESATVPPPAAGASSSDEASQATLLVVEDEEEVRRFIRHLLEENHYRVEEAVDGMDGLQKAMACMPDLVISDVLMPRMDGYELCGNIKSSKDLCHIPVILLTAKTLDENQLEGYTQGADVYLNKPFSPPVLLSIVANILRNHRLMAEQIARNTGKEADKVDITSSAEQELNPLDKRFLEKLNNFIATHIADCDLNVNLLGRELGFSRTNFYRKVKALTGMTPNDFLRTYRLHRALELMKGGTYSLCEISELTGFGTPSYFTTAFKRAFGMPPKEYLKVPNQANHQT